MLEKNSLSNVEKIHYEMVKNNQNEIVDKLNLRMGFYVFRPIGKEREYEVMYDTENNHLTSVGIVLSRQIVNGKNFIKLRKFSHINSQFKRPTIKYEITNAGKNVNPSNFATQIAQTIQDFFPNSFGIDLTDIVKRVVPKIEVKTKSDLYQIASGTGFKAEMAFQKIKYKDLITKRKIKNDEVELAFKSDADNEKGKQDVLFGIEKYCKELLPYKESRFEIARNYLKIRPKKQIQKQVKDKDKNKKAD